MSFKHSELSNRYHNDVNFATLVNAIHNMIITGGFTPSEIREAAFLAHYTYEMENPSAVLKRFDDNTFEFINKGIRPWSVPRKPDNIEDQLIVVENANITTESSPSMRNKITIHCNGLKGDIRGDYAKVILTLEK